MNAPATLSLIVDYGQILDAIGADIRATGLFLPAAKIEPAPGPLTEAWLKRNSMPHGGALPAIAGVRSITRKANGMHLHDLNLGLYFIPAPQKRKRQARDLARDVSEIIGHISLNRWQLAGVKVPEQMRATNRYSKTLDDNGATLWTIDWQQSFMLTEQDAAAKRLHLVSDEGGDDG